MGNRDLPVTVDYRSTTGLPSVSDRLSTVHRSATGYNLMVNRLPTAHRMPRLDLSHTHKTLMAQPVGYLGYGYYWWFAQNKIRGLPTRCPRSFLNADSSACAYDIDDVELYVVEKTACC